LPELDYALLCDYVRTEQTGVAHVIAASVDTVTLPQVPGAANLGLLVRLTFTRGECDKPHRLEAILAQTDGEPTAKINGVITPTWRQGMPLGWKTGAMLGLNFGVVLPKYGEYSMDILVNDSSVKDINLRVVPPPSVGE
jgi:hypothetical protein